MTNQKQYYFFFLFSLLLIILLQTGCTKEYSCEGGCNTITTVQDTIISSVPPVVINKFPSCSLCRATDALLLAKWSFKVGNTFLCGSVDAAGIDYAKTAFTFFGPSACSIDTGLVMTIYLSTTLDRDKFDISTTKVAFFYYDHHAVKDIFISRPETLFTVNIDSFIYATGILTGSFYGTVFKPNGDKVIVSEGKFKIKFK